MKKQPKKKLIKPGKGSILDNMSKRNEALNKFRKKNK